DLRVRAAAGAREHDALAELVMSYALTQADAGNAERAFGAPIDGPRHDHRRPDFLDELGRQLAQEARRDRVRLLTVQASLLGIGHVQLLARARDADVAKAPFLLEPGRIVQRALMREEAVLEPAKEDHFELETFGRMQR